MGYPSDVINKTIDNTMLKLNRTVEHGPKKFPVYLKLPYLGKQATFLENKVKDTVNNTFGAVNLRISHSTRKPQMAATKISLPIPKKTGARQFKFGQFKFLVIMHYVF